MVGHIARKRGTSGVQYPQDVHRRDCFATVSTRRRLSSEAKTAPPLPISRPRDPRPLPYTDHRALYIVSLQAP